MNARTKRRRAAHSWEWHEARMNEGPQGFIRERGVKSWDEFHKVCARFIADWDYGPPQLKRAYAYPNREDRRRNG